MDDAFDVVDMCFDVAEEVFDFLEVRLVAGAGDERVVDLDDMVVSDDVLFVHGAAVVSGGLVVAPEEYCVIMVWIVFFRFVVPEDFIERLPGSFFDVELMVDVLQVIVFAAAHA